MSNFDPLLGSHRTPGGHDLNKLESPLYREDHINFSFPGPVVLEKKIFKDFHYIIICRTLIPYCGPIVPPGVVI